MRKYFFVNRVPGIPNRNGLPIEVIECESVDSFKRMYDRCRVPEGEASTSAPEGAFYPSKLHGMNPGNNWMPPMPMPPLGFGVVLPQPGGQGSGPSAFSRMPHSLSQCQNFVSNADHSGGQWQFQPFSIAQQKNEALPVYQQQCVPNQQQWLLAQQKSAQEQKLMYEKMLKQRQFDEQKQRLKEFGSRKKKATVSADDMIQNIFDKQQPSSKPRTHKEPRANFSTEPENLSSQNYSISHTNPNQIFNSSYSNTPQPNFSYNQFSTETKETPLQPKCSNLNAGAVSISQNSVNSMHSNVPNSTIIPTSVPSAGPSSNSKPPAPINQDPLVNHSMPSGSSCVPIANSIGPEQIPSHRTPLKLPPWLVDPLKLPEVYTKASGLVQSDAEWVDTSRAYMLLMQTNVPPHFLGVLWEMVNRNHPGRLKVVEFHALLALVACVQAGRSFINPDILITLDNPVYPLIDHPVLLSLVEKPLQQETPTVVPDQKESGVSQKSLQEPSPLSLFQNTSSITSVPQVPQSEVLPSDQDEFDDFVSAVAPVPTPASTATPTSSNSVICTASSTTSILGVTPTTYTNVPSFPPNPVPSFDSSHSEQFVVSSWTQLNQCSKPLSNQTSFQLPPSQQPKTSSEQPKSTASLKNLPTLGSSPLNNRKPGKDNKVEEDDFNDFQSAPPLPPTSIHPQNPNPSIFQPSFPLHDPSPPLPSKVADIHAEGDKYAVFRDLGRSKGDDELFGDFHASHPVLEEVSPAPPRAVIPTHKTMEVSSALSMSVTEINDTSLGSWAGSDPFGAFTSAPQGHSSSLTEASSESSNYITANASADTSNDDDDFGDFVGPSDSASDSLNLFPMNTAPSVFSELKSETQSVASLELPGLELTVNLSACDVLPNSKLEGQSVQRSEEWSDRDLEQQFQTLRLDTKNSEEITSPKSISEDVSALPSIVPLSDKYSIIREEERKCDLVEPHIDSWKRCLEGCRKLLEEGVRVVNELQRGDPPLLEQVVATSQMKDYLLNLKEVWLVSERIHCSNSKGDSNVAVKELSSVVHQSWQSLRQALGKDAHKIDGLLKDFDVGEKFLTNSSESEYCSLCLGGGEVGLVYGGKSYHPPCANLWLNVVDLTLPAFSHARPTLL